jgi:hypothetical protein
VDDGGSLVLHIDVTLDKGSREGLLGRADHDAKPLVGTEVGKESLDRFRLPTRRPVDPGRGGCGLGSLATGQDSSVQNGQVFMFRKTDIMTNASGDRFRARSVFVADFPTMTVRVERFELTCLGP